MSAAGVGAGGGSKAGRAAREQGGTEALARAAFVALVVACFGAFFLIQHLKHTPTVLRDFKLTPRFSPRERGNLKDEAISFQVAHREPVTVAVIDTAGNTVATLVRDRTLERYKTFSLRWNGRRGTARRYEHLESATGRPILLALSPGAIAPTGEYRVEVTLQRAHKTVRSTRSFSLVAAR